MIGFVLPSFTRSQFSIKVDLLSKMKEPKGKNNWFFSDLFEKCAMPPNTFSWLNLTDL